MSYKLEKNFLLETRYENDKKSMKLFMIMAIIVPIYWIMYFAITLSWKKYYQKISQMRDEQREIELLNIIQTKRIKNREYIYALYALADLESKQVKEILIEKILKYDGIVVTYSTDAQNLAAYGVLLAYIERKEQEENWGK